MARLLDRWGFDTVPARTGAEASAILAQTGVDLVVIDLRLPDMRGDEVFHRLCREHPDLESRTLFMTGDFGEQAIGAIEQTGRPYLLKPFELGLFVHELRGLLNPVTAPEASGHGEAEGGTSPGVTAA
jgi:DNA-binding response OmpR family regulator